MNVPGEIEMAMLRKMDMSHLPPEQQKMRKEVFKLWDIVHVLRDAYAQRQSKEVMEMVLWEVVKQMEHTYDSVITLNDIFTLTVLQHLLILIKKEIDKVEQKYEFEPSKFNWPSSEGSGA